MVYSDASCISPANPMEIEKHTKSISWRLAAVVLHSSVATGAPPSSPCCCYSYCHTCVALVNSTIELHSFGISTSVTTSTRNDQQITMWMQLAAAVHMCAHCSRVWAPKQRAYRYRRIIISRESKIIQFAPKFSKIHAELCSAGKQ